MLDDIPLADQIACVKREVQMRRIVYPGRIAAKRMTQATADKEVARMEAVLRTLEAYARGVDELKGS